MHYIKSFLTVQSLDAMETQAVGLDAQYTNQHVTASC